MSCCGFQALLKHSALKTYMYYKLVECLQATVKPQFNEPLYDKVLSITNYILSPSNSKMYKMYGKEPEYM